jgi:pimeloyl-ACP methyl ester carboxylesterase
MRNPVEKYYAASNGDICYFEWGEAGDESSILLLHATGFHARCWDKLIEALPANRHIIAVDHRGHGRSSKPDSLSDWSQQARAIADLIEGLNLNSLIGVGHSMGGYCVVQVAGWDESRFQRLVLVDPTIVEAEVYINPPALSEIDPTDHPVARRRNIWASAEEMFEHFKDRHPYSLWDPEVLRDYCTYGLLSAVDGTHLELACPPHLESSIYQGFRCCDPYPSLANITVPILILRAQQGAKDGQMDFANSPTWTELASAFHNATDVFIPELSHFMPMQDPTRIASYILTE